MKKLLSILLLSTFILFSNIIDSKKSNYRIAFSLGSIYNFIEASQNSGASISFLTEWKAIINNKFDITFGPKISINTNVDNLKHIVFIYSGINLGGEVNFNYNLKENIKIYTGIEGQVGVGLHTRTYLSYIVDEKKDKKVVYNYNNTTAEYKKNTLNSLSPTGIISLFMGLKINDKYNIALYTGYGKGYIGLEAGYSF